MLKVFSVGCLMAAGSMLWAQPDEAKLRAAMKQIGPTTGGLNKKIAAKDASAAEDAKSYMLGLRGTFTAFGWK
ncbi:MAG: hypothetical protein IAF94_20700 [Pirellulaceae bacterium]|nr:hypothetical protein [Pirellulaceae bacterium]